MKALPALLVCVISMCAFTGCGLLNLGGLLPLPGTDAGTVEAKPPYKETADGRPCPGEKPDAKCQPYIDCAPTKCDAEYKQCLGPDYKNGNFGGDCKTFMDCGKGCGDKVCSSTCMCTLDTTCSDCFKDTLAPCVVTKCVDELYACAGLPPPSQGGACTKLQACCSTFTGSEKTSCETTLSSIRLGGDTACQSTLSAYQTSGKCNSVVSGADGGLDGPAPTVCSVNGGVATTINFKNNYPSQSIVTYWVNPSCVEVRYQTITPGGSYRQPTYTGHAWRIRDTSAHYLKDIPPNTDAGETTANVP